MIFEQDMCIDRGVWTNNCDLSPVIIIWAVCAIKYCRASVGLHPVCSKEGDGNHQQRKLQGVEGFKAISHGSGLANAAGVARARPKLSKILHFVDMTELVQRWALCLCSTAPHACAMPTIALVQCWPSCPCNTDPIVMGLGHWAHAFVPVGAQSSCHLSNWRFSLETVHFFRAHTRAIFKHLVALWPAILRFAAAWRP